MAQADGPVPASGPSPGSPGAGGGDGGLTALLVVDVLNTFDHEDGGSLLEEMRARVPGMQETLGAARGLGWRVVYANDRHEAGDEDPSVLLRRALAGPGGDDIRRLAPVDGEPVVVKPDYSAFDRTAMAGLLADLGVERLVVMGAVTEMCVRETAADAVRAGYDTAVVWAASVPLDDAEERAALEELERLGVEVLDRLDGGSPGAV